LGLIILIYSPTGFGFCHVIFRLIGGYVLITVLGLYPLSEAEHVIRRGAECCGLKVKFDPDGEGMEKEVIGFWPVKKPFVQLLTG
jgi:hypothetical protein